MATQLQKLAALLRSKPDQPPPPPPQMGGMAGQAQGILGAQHQYKQYAEEAMMQGRQPVPFEAFVQGQR